MANNERQHTNSRASTLDARKKSLLVYQRRYYIAAVTLLSVSSILGLVTIAVNIVNSTLKKVTLPYLILYYVISGLIIAGGATAAILLFFYTRASADRRNFSCFTIFLPMASSTAAVVGCLLSTYNAVITFGKIITDIFIINAGQAAVFITSAITSLLGIALTGLLWGVITKIDRINSAVAFPTESTTVPTNPSANPTTNPPANTSTNADTNPSANPSVNPPINPTMNVPIDPSTNIPSHPPAYTASSSVENGAANVNASIANQSRLAAQINEISPSHGQPSAPSDLPAYSQIA